MGERCVDVLFFLLVGLELKRESLDGHLRKKANLVLPAIAALGGIVCFDDIAAILIIAVFYSTDIALSWLAGATALIVILLLLNHRKVIGSFLWYCILKPGIHPTIAGVLLAFCIPFKTGARLEHLMHPWVAFGVLPIFAFFTLPLCSSCRKTVCAACILHPRILAMSLA